MTMTSDADPGRAARPDETPPAPISARRAYTETLIVFALVFASGIVSAGETLGNVPQPQTGGWAQYAPTIVQSVCDMVLISLVVILLSARRGVTSRRLGLRLPRVRENRPNAGRASLGRGIRMAALALVAFSVGGAVTAAVSMGDHLPLPAHVTVPYLVVSLFSGALFSGVVEEMVALAFVVTTLKQANRPTAEVVIVAVLLRCSYHIYYGPGVLGIVLWAAAFVFLYLRFRSVIPLIVMHVCWDGVQYLSLKWHAFIVVALAAALIFLVTALVLWIVDASSGGHPSPPYGTMPPYGTAPPYGPVPPYGTMPGYGAAPPYGTQPPDAPPPPELNGGMAGIAEFQELTGREHGLVTVSVLRDDGSISSTVVNAGVLPHPVTGDPVVGMVIRGGTRKLSWLRQRPYLNVVVRAGWQWAAAEGPAELIGPDDPREGFDAERIRVFLREIFTAAGGTHDDFDTYDRVMKEERRTAVLLTPRKIYSNPAR